MYLPLGNTSLFSRILSSFSFNSFIVCFIQPNILDNQLVEFHHKRQYCWQIVTMFIHYHYNHFTELVIFNSFTLIKLLYTVLFNLHHNLIILFMKSKFITQQLYILLCIDNWQLLEIQHILNMIFTFFFKIIICMLSFGLFQNIHLFANQQTWLHFWEILIFENQIY